MSFDDFKEKVAEDSSVYFLKKELILDFETTVNIVSKFFEKKPLFFCESAKDDRYHMSYLAFDPFMHIQMNEPNVIHVQKYLLGILHSDIKQANIYHFLDEMLKKYGLPTTDEFKFQSGILGYLSYECVQFLERIEFPEKREIASPLAELIIPKTLIRINNNTKVVQINRMIYFDEWANQPCLESLYDLENSALLGIVDALLTPSTRVWKPLSLKSDRRQYAQDDNELVGFTFSMDEDVFKKAVLTCKDYIEQGHIFQIQVSRRTAMALSVEPIDIYRFLRYTNPSPFMFFVRLKDSYLVGSSPEILVGVDSGIVTIRPLAGTRKRYSKTQTEEEIINELLSDEKERAEHVMLVDLARHDLGRCCLAGSVEVNELMGIEKYRHVIHIVSDVSGTLKPSMTAMDAFKYGFPAGTVTGTPKVRAMEIISELEPVQREFYSGGIVFFDFSNNLTSTLIIRSMMIKDAKVYTQAAGGIVADSDPDLELIETKNKMRSSIQAAQLK